MKKLKLSELNLGNAEVLSREELKKVLGGMGSGSGGDKCNVKCSSDSDCDDTCSFCDEEAKNGGPGYAMCVSNL